MPLLPLPASLFPLASAAPSPSPAYPYASDSPLSPNLGLTCMGEGGCASDWWGEHAFLILVVFVVISVGLVVGVPGSDPTSDLEDYASSSQYSESPLIPTETQAILARFFAEQDAINGPYRAMRNTGTGNVMGMRPRNRRIEALIAGEVGGLPRVGEQEEEEEEEVPPPYEESVAESEGLLRKDERAIAEDERQI